MLHKSISPMLLFVVFKYLKYFFCVFLDLISLDLDDFNTEVINDLIFNTISVEKKIKMTVSMKKSG